MEILIHRVWDIFKECSFQAPTIGALKAFKMNLKIYPRQVECDLGYFSCGSTDWKFAAAMDLPLPTFRHRNCSCSFMLAFLFPGLFNARRDITLVTEKGFASN